MFWLLYSPYVSWRVLRNGSLEKSIPINVLHLTINFSPAPAKCTIVVAVAGLETYYMLSHLIKGEVRSSLETWEECDYVFCARDNHYEKCSFEQMSTLWNSPPFREKKFYKSLLEKWLTDLPVLPVNANVQNLVLVFCSRKAKLLDLHRQKPVMCGPTNKTANLVFCWLSLQCGEKTSEGGSL